MVTAIVKSKRLSGTTMQKRRKRQFEHKRTSNVNGIGAFKNDEEARIYLSGDSITCLICGKEYRSLGKHLVSVHDMDPLDYHKRYNIPLGMKLMTQDLIEIHRNNASRPERLAKTIPAFRAAQKTRKKPQNPRFLTEEQRKKKSEMVFYRCQKADPVSDEMALKYERLVQEEGFSKSVAAKIVGHPYQSLDYARKKIARRNGKADPPPLTSIYVRKLPAHLYHNKPKYKEVTVECMAEVVVLVQDYGVTTKEVLRSLGFGDVERAYGRFQYLKRKAAPETQENEMPKCEKCQNRGYFENDEGRLQICDGCCPHPFSNLGWKKMELGTLECWRCNTSLPDEHWPADVLKPWEKEDK